MGKSGKFFQGMGFSFLFKVILVLGLSLDLFAGVYDFIISGKNYDTTNVTYMQVPFMTYYNGDEKFNNSQSENVFSMDIDYKGVISVIAPTKSENQEVMLYNVDTTDAKLISTSNSRTQNFFSTTFFIEKPGQYAIVYKNNNTQNNKAEFIKIDFFPIVTNKTDCSPAILIGDNSNDGCQIGWEKAMSYRYLPDAWDVAKAQFYRESQDSPIAENIKLGRVLIDNAITSATAGGDITALANQYIKNDAAFSDSLATQNYSAIIDHTIAIAKLFTEPFNPTTWTGAAQTLIGDIGTISELSFRTHTLIEAQRKWNDSWVAIRVVHDLFQNFNGNVLDLVNAKGIGSTDIMDILQYYFNHENDFKLLFPDPFNVNDSYNIFNRLVNGLVDEAELYKYSYLKYTDVDGDGISNIDEVANGTDPNSPNTQDPTTTNHRPQASFTLDKSSANIGDTITATSNSTDEDGDTLTYTWHLFKPDGSSATLSYNSDKSKAYFTADKEGSYTLALNVGDGELYHNVFKKIIVNKAYTATDLIIEKEDDKNHIYLENINVDPCDFKQIAKITIPNNEKWKYLKLVGSKENIAIITKWNQKPTPQDGDWKDMCHNGYDIWKRFNGQVYDFHKSTKIYTTNISSHNAGDILYIYAYSPDTQEGGGVSNYSLNSIVGIDQDQDGDGVPDNKDAFKNDPNEQYDSDHDGIGDNADAFSNDPAASVDSDGDGCPDRWNDGYTQADSTTGLKIDMFPKDKDKCEEDNTGSIDLLKGLVAHYEFEGDANDSSGNGNDMQTHNVNFINGIAYTNGTDSTIKLSSFHPSGNEISFFALVKFNSFKDINPIVDHHAGFNIWYKNNDKKITFYIGNSSPTELQADFTMETDKWYSVVATFDGKTKKLYVNGQLIGQQQSTGSLPDSDYPFFVMSDETAVYRYSDGAINSFRIYNRALNEQEVKALCKLEQPKIDLNNGLVAHYEFEGDAKDSSGNGNDGTQHGGVKYVDGVIGKAAKFDGVDDYIRNNNFSFATSSDFTISAWIKPIQKAKWYLPIMSIHQGNTGYINFGDKQIGLVMNQNFIFQGMQSANNGKNGNYVRSYSQQGVDWYHMVYIVKNGVGKIYLNGNIETNESINNRGDLGLSVINGYLEIGALNFWGGGDGWSNNGRDKKWNGLIDDLRIYNRALNEQEIKALYKEGNLSSAKKTISIQKGWNLIALPESFSLDNDDMQLLWTNDGSSAFGGWRVYSSVQDLKNLIASKNIPLINAINSNRGYWYLSDKDKNLSVEDKNVTFDNTILKSGWNLVGTNANISTKDIKCPDSYQAISLWRFKNKTWELNTEIPNNYYYKSFDTIFANEGFWVYCQKSQPEQITCSEDEKEVNGICIKKTCKDDGYACPTCDTQSEVLKYNSDGSGYCEALPKRSLYAGKWTGIDHLYLVNDPSAYCKWSFDVTINSDGTGSATGTLIEHNKDQGYCENNVYVTFAITREDSNSFSGKITSSGDDTFGGSYNFSLTYQNNKILGAADTNIAGYPAKEEVTLTRQ